MEAQLTAVYLLSAIPWCIPVGLACNYAGFFLCPITAVTPAALVTGTVFSPTTFSPPSWKAVYHVVWVSPPQRSEWEPSPPLPV